MSTCVLSPSSSSIALDVGVPSCASFNSLLSIGDAIKFNDVHHSSIDECVDALSLLIVGHGLAASVGIARLHQHFGVSLAKREIVVTTFHPNTATPIRVAVLVVPDAAAAEQLVPFVFASVTGTPVASDAAPVPRFTPVQWCAPVAASSVAAMRASLLSVSSNAQFCSDAASVIAAAGMSAYLGLSLVHHTAACIGDTLSGDVDAEISLIESTDEGARKQEFRRLDAARLASEREHIIVTHWFPSSSQTLPGVIKFACRDYCHQQSDNSHETYCCGSDDAIDQA